MTISTIATVYRVYLTSMGYASKRGQLPSLAGRYFGVGAKVWAVESARGSWIFVRADSAKLARAIAVGQ
jgi:hypothetical protein